MQRILLLLLLSQASSQDVVATLNYLEPKLGAGLLASVSFRKQLRDARAMSCRLETCGFELGSMNMSHVASSIETFEAERSEQKKQLMLLAVHLLEQRIPHAKVIPFDTKCRRSTAAGPPEGFRAYMAGHAPVAKGCFYGERPAAPFTEVHGDYTKSSAVARIESLATRPGPFGAPQLPQRLFERLLAGQRFFFVNVWGNLSPQAMKRQPLALLDARTVLLKDTFAWVQQGPNSTAVYDGFSGGSEVDYVKESLGVRASSAHQWYYFPQLRRGEVLLFKTYDSLDSQRMQASLHSAFEHPATKSTDAMRESFEVRLLVVTPEAK